MVEKIGLNRVSFGPKRGPNPIEIHSPDQPGTLAPPRTPLPFPPKKVPLKQVENVVHKQGKNLNPRILHYFHLLIRKELRTEKSAALFFWDGI